MENSDGRLTDLEVRLAFLERAIDALDAVVREGMDRVDALRSEVASLRSGMDVASVRGGPGEERPPHHLGPVPE